MKRVVLYSRVSTKRQDLEIQMVKLKQFAKAKDWLVVEEIFEKESGKKTDRPGYMKLMDMARKSQIDLVCVYKLDRFARTLKQIVDSAAEFREIGVDFVSFHENIDTSTTSGILYFHMCAAFSEFVASNIRDSVMQKIQYLKDKGVQLGRKNTLVTSKEQMDKLKAWAIKKEIKNRKLVFVDVEKIKELRATHTMRETARLMNLSLGAIQRALKPQKLDEPRMQKLAVV
jgi:DNA invertase Pin-like site-specific DNA recombinase